MTRPYIAQIRSNLRLMGRDRAVLFFSYLFPLVFFFVFAQSFRGAQSPAAMTQVVSMVLIIGVLGNGFFGAGMRAVQDRETNVLRRFKVAPISAAPIIVASLVSGLVAFLPSMFFVFFFAATIYHMPLPHNLLSVFLFICIGVLAFRSMGMIIAAVVNSAQEAGILVQLLYLPMLFLSGATFPMTMMPVWIQIIAQFLPATYLYQGVQSILIGGQGMAANLASVGALVVTFSVALTVGIKLFRWEKEEKIRNSAKLWVVAVLAPFLLMGLYQARTRHNITEARILARTAEQGRSVLFQNPKIFVGDGSVIENGAVLVKNGKIAEVFAHPPQEPERLDAEVIDASGKTLIPGLIDLYVHIGSTDGSNLKNSKLPHARAEERRLAAYLYSGVTALRSSADSLNDALPLRSRVRSGEYLGAELFTCGPVFSTAEAIMIQPLEWPKSRDSATSRVDELKRDGVDCISIQLDGDPDVYRALIERARHDRLPSSTYSESTAGVKASIEAGTNVLEHGPKTALISDAVFGEMKEKGIAYDPMLSLDEAARDSSAGETKLLDRSLVQQVEPAELLADTRSMVDKMKANVNRDTSWTEILDAESRNLLNAYRAGVLLIAGSGAGATLVIHGPTVQHELELWVKAGIPPSVALQAATYNAAKVLRQERRIGSIQKGRDATVVLLDGDPLQDISNTER
ncbi:MAG: ABC transporter permease, partial [Acidobacteriaceae bacterium]|nr:ABC transporter permease [Acidobacteriaceae bacterium]